MMENKIGIQTKTKSNVGVLFHSSGRFFSSSYFLQGKMNAHVLAVTDKQTWGKVLGRGKMEMKRPTKPPDEKMIEPIFMQTWIIKVK